MRFRGRAGAGASRPLRLFLIAVAATLAIGAAMVLRSWFWIVPRAARRRIADGFLTGLLAAYGLLLVLVPVGLALAVGIWIRARSRPEHRLRAARFLLLALSGLIGLALAEGSAALWRGYLHRIPDLPETFRDVRGFARTDLELPTRFDDGEGPGERVEIVVVGESSARGEPYHPWLSVGQVVAWQLERAMPARRFHAEVLAMPGSTLEWQHQRLETLARRPDVLIVYAGHNEFQSRYRWERIEPPPGPSGRGPISIATPLGRLIAETSARTGIDVAPPPKVVRRLVDWPVCSPAEYAAVRDDFGRRLEAIVAWAERLGTLPVLVIPPGNDAGFEPNRSVAARRLSELEARDLEREFARLRAAEATDPDQSRAGYLALLGRHPRFAEAHHRLARLLEAAGEHAAAYDHFVRARDADGFPQRCPTDLQDCYRSVAARHPGVVLVDGQAVFRALRPRGILDDHLFHDAQHPTLLGHVALAQAVVDGMRSRRALDWPGDDEPPPLIDPAECAAHFGLDPERWAVVCEAGASFYERTAFLRYDPRERRAKAQRARQAARDIRAGLAPERTGLPGVGLRPGDVEALRAARRSWSEHRVDEGGRAGGRQGHQDAEQAHHQQDR